jgi:hypothetical protein
MRYPRAFLVPILGLLLALPVAAQPDSDVIGIYFDLQAHDTCWDCISVGQQLSAYLILTNLSAPPSGMEAKISVDLPATVVDLGFQPIGPIIWIVPPQDGEVYMGWSEPPAPELVPVIEMRYLFLGEARLDFFVGPVSSPSIPGWPAYVTAEEPPRTLPLIPVSGSVDERVAWIDTTCDTCFPLASPTDTWGGVKSLYR